MSTEIRRRQGGIGSIDMTEDVLGLDLHLLFGKAVHRQAGILVPGKSRDSPMHRSPDGFLLAPLIHPGYHMIFSLMRGIGATAFGQWQ